MKNYAGIGNCNKEVSQELNEAGIEVYQLPFELEGEVKTSIIGILNPSQWSFKRAWTYWVAEGPGIPPKEAKKLHKKYGKVVRVSGHCRCPSPKESFKGFGCGLYHVDTIEGLKALADVIKKILKENQ